MILKNRAKDIADVYSHFRNTCDKPEDAIKLTEIYFAMDGAEALQNVAAQLGRSEVEKTEFYEWEKRDPRAVTPPPLVRE